MNRAFERLPNESSKAFRAFSVYRDLGPERSLVKVAEIYYGSTANLAQLKVWSKKHDWVARATAFDDWRELMVQSAIEERAKEKAHEHAEREVALREAALEIRELAARQARMMLQFPLTDQRVVEEDEDGRPVTYLFSPARWSKGTAATLFNLVVGHAVQQPEEEDQEADFEDMTDEELAQWIELSYKVGVRRTPGG